MIVHDRNVQDSQSLAVPYLAHPVSNESSMAPLDAGQTSGTDNGPLLSGAGLPSDPPLSKKRTWKRAENPPQTVDDLRSRDFASPLLQVNLFFFFFFLPSLGNSRLLLARSCERQRQNSSLMGRLWLDTRVLFFRTSPWE